MAIIVKPLVTEKMNNLAETQKKYGFIVNPKANKIEIKAEIESLYNVTVVGISTMRYAGKAKNRNTRAGFIKGRTNAFKKAIVTLKDGDVIDFYSNIYRRWQYVNLNLQHRVKGTKLLVRSKKLLHQYQKRLSFVENVLQAAVTMSVR